jgi:GDP/UDP-N,N'-diacetylbacillosamine 2-epimerase (hydrolysing)
MNIAILTSSRADYGIWLPLLKLLRNDAKHSFELVVFGTHLSSKHGHTVDAILADGFDVHHRLDTLPEGDQPEDIAVAMGKTMHAFAHFWRIHGQRFDVVLCLGDRYEMFAAVAAAAPFGLNIAHVHGGETTLGAIDNAFRHSITHFSRMHFVSAEAYAERVRQLCEEPRQIAVVGALGLDNTRDIEMLSKETFTQAFGFGVDEKTILCTFHPETINADQNQTFGRELIDALQQLTDYRVLMTLPNADTYGDTLRRMYTDAFAANPRIQLAENLGTLGYMSAMKHCAFLLGNTSSGIIEAASFGKYVIDLGDRQKGRAHGLNVVHAPVQCDAILAAVRHIATLGPWEGGNIYDLGGAARRIIHALESEIS